ncbi:type IV pilus inner membrane component PilO [Anaerosinus massiliensis]|uniref:type 4a pilus biogenesis protein PilO n=1 Tax=Massilibacillus massiliensis TaxID=1806837 RepID=UPI000DA63538|nr:type 4a pilus biogenesis protein PilO [Massilibacillus massiliensis]
MNKVNYKLKYQLILCITIICCIVSSFYNYIYHLQQIEIFELGNIKQENEQKVRRIEEFTIQHPDISEYEQEIKQKMESANKRLPSQNDLSNFLMDIRKISEETQVELIFIKPKNTIDKDNYRYLLLDIKIKGDYSKILIFLKKLESLARFNTINKMVIKTVEDSLITEIELNLYTYGALKNNMKEQSNIEFRVDE